MTALSKGFLTAPIAHRGLHDVNDGRPENSRAAFRAAITNGYGIEIDIQCSRDGHAMVFHDYDLGRLTTETGSFHQRNVADLVKIPLKGGDETIPTFADVLNIIDGRVPLLIEIKDQDGALGPNTGVLEKAVASDLKNYGGEVAVMSFNPYSVALMVDLLPGTPRGLVTGPFSEEKWAVLSKKTRDELREIPDIETVSASFISHKIDDLDRPRVAEIRAAGKAVLCWTVRNAKTEAAVRKNADNITFEGYLPDRRAA